MAYKALQAAHRHKLQNSKFIPYYILASTRAKTLRPYLASLLEINWRKANFSSIIVYLLGTQPYNFQQIGQIVL